MRKQGKNLSQIYKQIPEQSQKVPSEHTTQFSSEKSAFSIFIKVSAPTDFSLFQNFYQEFNF